ncbi:MAG: hypothetical protein ACOC9H_01965 [Gemmatimonadota bacterium]
MSEREKTHPDARKRQLRAGDKVSPIWIASRPHVVLELLGDKKVRAWSPEVGEPRIYPSHIYTLRSRGGHKVGDPRDRNNEYVDVGDELRDTNDSRAVVRGLLAGAVWIEWPSGLEEVVLHDDLATRYRRIPPKPRSRLVRITAPDPDRAIRLIRRSLGDFEIGVVEVEDE